MAMSATATMMIVAFIGIVVMAVVLFGAIPFTMMAMMAALTAASVAAALAATATAAFAAHHAEHALNLFIGNICQFCGRRMMEGAIARQKHPVAAQDPPDQFQSVSQAGQEKRQEVCE